jgi:hypothetical protein
MAMRGQDLAFEGTVMASPNTIKPDFSNLDFEAERARVTESLTASNVTT